MSESLLTREMKSPFLWGRLNTVGTAQIQNTESEATIKICESDSSCKKVYENKTCKLTKKQPKLTQVTRKGREAASDGCIGLEFDEQIGQDLEKGDGEILVLDIGRSVLC